MPSRWVTGSRCEPGVRPVFLRRASRSMRLASAAACTSCCLPAPGMTLGNGLPGRPGVLLQPPFHLRKPLGRPECRAACTPFVDQSLTESTSAGLLLTRPTDLCLCFQAEQAPKGSSLVLRACWVQVGEACCESICLGALDIKQHHTRKDREPNLPRHEMRLI